MSRSTRGGNMYRYAFLILYKEKEACPVPQGGRGETKRRYASLIVKKLNQGRRRRKDVPLHKGGGGKHMAAGEGRMSRSTKAGEGETENRYAQKIVKLNHGGPGAQPYVGSFQNPIQTDIVWLPLEDGGAAPPPPPRSLF